MSRGSFLCARPLPARPDAVACGAKRRDHVPRPSTTRLSAGRVPWVAERSDATTPLTCNAGLTPSPAWTYRTCISPRPGRRVVTRGCSESGKQARPRSHPQPADAGHLSRTSPRPLSVLMPIAALNLCGPQTCHSITSLSHFSSISPVPFLPSFLPSSAHENGRTRGLAR